MQNQSLTSTLCVELRLREHRIERIYDSHEPALAFLLSYILLQYRLHQSMHRERVCMRITGEQGVGTQLLNGLVEQVGVSSHRGQVGTKMLCPFCDNLFRNGIRG